ncbi:hypothetical protein HPP92_011917 [Vanilla planifolia]|uniref:non-specific serine/threonine protein kinase n=1 Tax=Vanilla planifolia TaxID=51239 RepID=A0A835V3Y8_VANPL|nr:hypothetical protein HPP92_011917 [Vanilla planifolia]
MCRMGRMKKLLLLENQLTGEIPANYANCSSLIRFRVSKNSLSGTVPPGIWGLPKVNIIDLEMNQFEGPITKEIGNAKALNQLSIAHNKFSGDLPQEISGASALVAFDSSSNQLSGEIPASIGQLKSLSSLYLDNNHFSGQIPATIGACSALNAMSLAGNWLSGQIPSTIGDLPNINTLNLSGNQLSGDIPASLGSLKLSSFDLSGNRLTGKVPAALCISAYNESFIGNSDLCADNTEYLKQCSLPSTSDKLRIVLIAAIITFAVLLVCIRLHILLKKRVRAGDGLRASWDLKSFGVITFDEQEIIHSMKPENLIGKGGSGEVYRVVLESGNVVAVKQIWNAGEGDRCGKGVGAAMLARRSSARSKEFEAEVATLSAIRHVNVVKLYCSITGEDSSLLVYEYLPNGSLWDRLHTVAGEKLGWLDWETRYNIAVGAARGLEYLHHGCDRPVLHRDVKSCNILLDEEFRPRIADFGLSKILHPTNANDSTTHYIPGTHGYIAPEYAYTWKVDEKSDVYSFGVVLLELVTGRRPVEVEQGEQMDIVRWVAERINSRESVLALVDDQIVMAAEREAAVRVLRVAVLCTAGVPAMRPSMRVVLYMLEEVAASRAAAAGGGKQDAAEEEEKKNDGVKGDCEKVV